MARTSKKRKRMLARVDAEKAYPDDSPPPPAPKPWWQFWKTTNNDSNNNNNKEESIAIDISDKKK